MKIEIIPCLQDNYSYLIIDENNKNACVIDPSEAKPIINFLEKHNIKLNYILNTHHHFDHVGGNSELKKKYNAKVIGYVEDSKRIPDIDIMVKDENKIITDKPDYVIILAWHLTKRIISLLLKKGYKGNFITPLPKLKILKN